VGVVAVLLNSKMYEEEVNAWCMDFYLQSCFLHGFVFKGFQVLGMSEMGWGAFSCTAQQG